MELTDDEREAFEAYYLEHPDVVPELEAAARFKVGLMKLRDTGELSKLLQREQRRQWPYFAAAAAVAEANGTSPRSGALIGERRARGAQGRF